MFPLVVGVEKKVLVCVGGYSVDLDAQAVSFNVHGTVQECQTCSSDILTGEFDVSIHYVDVFSEGFYFQCSDPDIYSMLSTYLYQWLEAVPVKEVKASATPVSPCYSHISIH